MRRILTFLSILFAFVLFSLNLTGIFSVQRHDEVRPNSTRFGDDISISLEQALKRIHHSKSLPFDEKVRDVTLAISESTGHYNPEKQDDNLMGVSVFMNYLLWAAPAFDAMTNRLGLPINFFSEYQFMDHELALERGVGMCGQMAIIVSGYLADMDTESDIIMLSGHVVASATDGDKEWLLDADKGVVLPFGLQHAQTHLHDVRTLYSQAGISGEQLDRIVEKYGPEGNGRAPGGAKAYRPKLYQFERAITGMKWILPMMFLLFGALNGSTKRSIRP